MTLQPSHVGEGSLDMSLRKLLTHMMDKKLDHVVLVIPDEDVQISITVATSVETSKITKQIERILR